jgi:hypothetical protein
VLTAPAPEVTFTVGIRLRNPSNYGRTQSALAATIAARERRTEHQAGCIHTRAAMAKAGLRPTDLVPAVVTLVRVSAGRLDEHDGLRSSMKWFVDGIAEALGVDDGGGAIQWLYHQQRGARGRHAIGVRIQRKVLP